MIIYHGSNKIISQPVFGQGKKYNDYGQVFYCTDSLEMAKEWAVREHQSGFANCYEIDETALAVLNLNAEPYNTLHWLTMLLQNRKFDANSTLAVEAKAYLISTFDLDFSKYDLIKGYRADDSYFSFAQDFLNGTISYRQLTNAMHLGQLGDQIMIKSKKAFARISFKGYEIAEWEEYYAKKQLRDRKARHQYFDTERNRRRKDDLFIIHLLDEEVKPDDPRLR